MSDDIRTSTRFAALRVPEYRRFFVAVLLAMTGDSIEHVISYWVMFQQFHSPALAGFAVISHWVPFLLLALPLGSLADRRDCRRLVQISQALFMLASAGWGVLVVTDTLEVWHAAMILLVHGVAGVVGAPALQLLIHAMVGAEALPSAIRLNASSRYVAILLGPALGAGLMLVVSPASGLLANFAFYLPLTLLVSRLAYTGHVASEPASAPLSRRVVLRGVGRLRHALGDDGRIMTMTALVGGASFFVGNAFQAQMPRYAEDLGADETGLWYSGLLAGNAAGAVLGAVLLETLPFLRPSPRAAIAGAGAWAVALGLFAVASDYATALALLFLAGLCDIAFTSMAQTLVQMLAPPQTRGRIVGVFTTAALGLRAGSGLTVGLLGAMVGVRASLALGAAAVGLVALALFIRETRRPAARHAEPRASGVS